MKTDFQALMDRRQDERMEAMLLGMDFGTGDSLTAVTVNYGPNKAMTFSDFDHMTDVVRRAFSPTRLAESAILAAESAPRPEPGLLHHNPIREPVSFFGGIKIVSSPAFPMTLDCSVCDGTGEGIESTYCESCQGHGQNRFDGMITNTDGSVTLLKGEQHGPKKFAPYFPAGLVPMPPLSRGPI